jgi:hypothetical protein
MEKSDDELLKSLIAGGIIGGTMAALLSDKKNQNKNTTLAAIAGAAIVASYQASQRAKETNLPIYKIKNGSLIIEYPDGRIETIEIQDHFKESQFSPKRLNDNCLFEKFRVTDGKLFYENSNLLNSYISSDIAEFFRKKLVKLEFDFSFETVINGQNIPNWFMNYVYK